jgi:hypothetical protein
VQLGTGRPFQRARLRYDSVFALEAEYCHDRGIPYSEFLERWSPEDRTKLAAVALEKAARCPRCGTSPWMWEEDPFAYEPLHITCIGCMKKDLFGEDDTPRSKGTSVQLIPKEAAEKMRARADEGIARPVRRRRPR